MPRHLRDGTLCTGAQKLLAEGNYITPMEIAGDPSLDEAQRQSLVQGAARLSFSNMAGHALAAGNPGALKGMHAPLTAHAPKAPPRSRTWRPWPLTRNCPLRSRPGWTFEAPASPLCLNRPPQRWA